MGRLLAVRATAVGLGRLWDCCPNGAAGFMIGARRLRILQVVPTYLPATRYGGPIYSVHGLASALAGLDHEVHVFTTNVDGSEVSQVPLGRPVDMDGVN